MEEAFRSQMLSRNCGICRLFEDSTPKVSPGQDSDLEEQKLSAVQSHQGVKRLVACSGFQEDWQRSDNAVLGKLRWGWRLCCIEQREKIGSMGVSIQQSFSFTRSILWPACKVTQSVGDIGSLQMKGACICSNTEASPKAD